MNWGRSRYGGKYHAMNSNGSLCGVAVHVVTTITPHFDHRCDNCDKEWRERGREKKPAAHPDPTVYLSRHRFEHFERERV